MNTYCGRCENQLSSYDHEIIKGENGILEIKFIGYCPHCGFKHYWIERYQFVETTWAKEF